MRTYIFPPYSVSLMWSRWRLAILIDRTLNCVFLVYRIICFDFHVKSVRNVPTFRLLNNCKTVIDTRARRESSLLLSVVNNATITLRRVARYRHRREAGVKIAEWRGSLLKAPIWNYIYITKKKNLKRDVTVYAVCVVISPEMLAILSLYSVRGGYTVITAIQIFTLPLVKYFYSKPLRVKSLGD
ncbi:unnamed protein product [Aphis gossypii]|uniref:Uncharacterized protein n=1 Tax=Aphis gossypii TaxID=80765 RepID=A0A9P0NNY6_APHGO|nr:unnamed protein product [Aphis gossypii]